MMVLIKAKAVPLTWVDYCAMAPVDRLVWEERGNELNKAILYLMNLKNNNAKKDLRLAYSQENMTAYPPTIKGMTRYLSTEYPNKISAHQRDGKRGIHRRGMIRNLKTRIVTPVAIQVHTLDILHHLKSPQGIVNCSW